jgi:hypothetical protein
MPNPSSYADHIRDKEALLGATRDHEALLPDIERHRAPVEQQLEVIKTAKSRQELAAATARRATQELNEALAEGQKRAIRLRGAVKAHLGHDNQLLSQFGIAPVPFRKRTRRVAEPPEATPQPDPETPTATPAVVRFPAKLST